MLRFEDLVYGHKYRVYSCDHCKGWAGTEFIFVPVFKSPENPHWDQNGIITFDPTSGDCATFCTRYLKTCLFTDLGAA